MDLEIEPVGRSLESGYHASWRKHYGGVADVVGGIRSVQFTEPDSAWCHKIWRGECGPPGTEVVVLHEFGHGAGYNHLPSSGSQMWADLVMEYISGSQLFDKITQQENQTFGEKEAAGYMKQLVRAINHVHA